MSFGKLCIVNILQEMSLLTYYSNNNDDDDDNDDNSNNNNNNTNNDNSNRSYWHLHIYMVPNPDKY